MYPPLNQLKVRQVPLTYENWLEYLKKPLPERPLFSIQQNTIEIGQVLGEFLGVPIDTDEYYNQLFDYVHSEEWKLHLLSEDSLDKSISNHYFQSIQKIININQEQKLSINRFTAFLDGEQLIIKSKIPVIHRKLRETMIAVLEKFAKFEEDGLGNIDLRRVLVDLIKWSINHLQPVLENADPEKEMPKFIWYGDVKKSHQYFLFYLIKLGCDLVVFHPEGKDVLAGFIEEPVFIHRFPKQIPPEPFSAGRNETEKQRSHTVLPRKLKQFLIKRAPGCINRGS